jgi:acyl-CoA thioester hydrolase
LRVGVQPADEIRVRLSQQKRARRARLIAVIRLMAKTPIVYRSIHRIRFSELDPWNHVSTGRYATHFVDHRMACLRDHLGWDVKSFEQLGFATWVRSMEIEFLRPARGDQEIIITSHVREFRGSEAIIECTMSDSGGNKLSRCSMCVSHVDNETRRATDWPPELRELFFEKEAIEDA